MHVAIAGNIGSGKTTLTNLLSKHYNWDTHFEDVDQNPYLNDFYHDMQRWSFNLQIYYLNSRFTQIQQRGRDYEESIRLDYLKRLNERYEAWISTYDKGKLLIIDVDNNRFPENQEDLGKIINAIDAEINGLF